MAKHYLDPKQTEGLPTVEVYRSLAFGWMYRAVQVRRPFVSRGVTISGGYHTEAEALAAARKAAGYETEE